MSLLGRAAAAYRAFAGPQVYAAPARDAVKLRSMPTQVPGRRANKRVERLAFDYRRWMPSDVENALSTANGAGHLTHAAAIAAWVKSNPIVYGVMEGRASTPWLPCGVKYSDEASAWLLGSESEKGWRERIADPSELEAISIDDYNAGFGVGIFVWNEQNGHPELVALDNAGLRYLPGEDRYQYHGWSRVFDVEPGNGVWVLKTRVKSDPWRDGAWHKLAYAIMDSLQGDIQRAMWMHVFSMPTILAKYPLGSSEEQKARFTNSILGSALRVIGVTPGFDLDAFQASAEGAQTFKDVNERLERVVSILVWGTVGLLAGGSGFANSDLFAEQKAAVMGKEARKQAAFENAQIWPVALDWAVRAGRLTRGSEQACLEYIAKSPTVIKKESEAIEAGAKAYKALVDAGIDPDFANMKVSLQIPAHGVKTKAKEIFAYHIQAGVVTLNEVRDGLGFPPTPWGEARGQGLGDSSAGETPAAPEAREDEPIEPSYGEKLALRLTERGDTECPHGRRPYCRSCGVRVRHEEVDGQWREVWHPIEVAA